MEIIAFGTHLSKADINFQGYREDGYICIHSISVISNDDEQSIVSSYGLSVLNLWLVQSYIRIWSLFRDCFEMSAAVQSEFLLELNCAYPWRRKLHWER
jgi:hypothetical protein